MTLTNFSNQKNHFLSPSTFLNSSSFKVPHATGAILTGLYQLHSRHVQGLDKQAPIWLNTWFRGNWDSKASLEDKRRMMIEAIKKYLDDHPRGEVMAQSIGYAIAEWGEGDKEELYTILKLILGPGLEEWKRDFSSFEFNQKPAAIEGLGYAAAAGEDYAIEVLTAILDEDKRKLQKLKIKTKNYVTDSYPFRAGRALTHAAARGMQWAKDKIKVVLGRYKTEATGVLRGLHNIAFSEKPGAVEILYLVVQRNDPHELTNFESALEVLARKLPEWMDYYQYMEEQFSEVVDFISEQRIRFPFFQNKSDVFVLGVSQFSVIPNSLENLIGRYFDRKGHYNAFQQLANISDSYFVVYFLDNLKVSLGNEFLENPDHLDLIAEVLAQLDDELEGAIDYNEDDLSVEFSNAVRQIKARGISKEAHSTQEGIHSLEPSPSNTSI